MLGVVAWFSGHPWGSPMLILAWAMAWLWASLSSRRIDLGAKQGLVWNGWRSVCINRGKDPFDQGNSWNVQDVLTQKSQRVETHWLSNDQRESLARWVGNPR